MWPHFSQQAEYRQMTQEYRHSFYITVSIKIVQAESEGLFSPRASLFE